MIIRYSLELDACRHPLIAEEAVMPYAVQKLDAPDVITDMMNTCFRLRYQAEEKIYLIALDHQMKSLGVFEVAHGQVSQCLISCREIFIRALAAGAACIVIAHNHPSGNTEPSAEDRALCQRICEAGQILGIPLEDFLIVGDGFYSAREAEMF